MAQQHELLADDLQISRIAQREQVTGTDILVMNVRLRANVELPLIDPEQYVTLRDLSQRIANGAGVVGFSAGGTGNITISNWDTLYSQQYGTGKFWVQYLNTDGTITDHFDIPVTRSFDRTDPDNPFQTSVSLDFGLIPLPGQIVIEYSNVPILSSDTPPTPGDNYAVPGYSEAGYSV